MPVVAAVIRAVAFIIECAFRIGFRRRLFADTSFSKQPPSQRVAAHYPSRFAFIMGRRVAVGVRYFYRTAAGPGSP